MPLNEVLIIAQGEGKSLGIVTTKVSSEQTGDAYTILELTLQPGQGAPPHVHRREDEVFLVIEGTCEVGSPGATSLAQVGTVAVFPRGIEHLFRNPGDAPCRVMITAIPGGLDRYFEVLAEIKAGDPDVAQKVNEINARFEIEFQTG